MFELKYSTELLPHQEEFKEIFPSKKVIGLFDEPGLGKSLEILTVICQCCEEGDKALVVCPPHLVANWKYEIEKFTYLDLGIDIDLFPYTQLGKKINDFKKYRLIADDEGHYLKNLDAQRTVKFMTYLMDASPEYFIHATGTPMGNRIPELYTFLLMLSEFEHVSPKITDKYPTYYQFCERFCHVKAVGYGSGFKYHGNKNVEELKAYLRPWTIRRKASEVLSLPEVDSQYVIASYNEGTELARAWEEHASTGDIGGVDISAKKNAAIAKASFTAKWVIEAIENGEGPVIVFSDHRDPIHIIRESLSKAKKDDGSPLKVGVVMGGQKMSDRDLIVAAFQRGELDAILLTIGAGSTGITLTRSNLKIFNDIPWVPKDLDQAMKRFSRISQTRRGRCVFVIGSRADDQITMQLRAKIKDINAVMED